MKQEGEQCNQGGEIDVECKKNDVGNNRIDEIKDRLHHEVRADACIQRFKELQNNSCPLATKSRSDLAGKCFARAEHEEQVQQHHHSVAHNGKERAYLSRCKIRCRLRRKKTSEFEGPLAPYRSHE